MTLTLELAPDAEQQLNERAARRGQSVADYLLTLAEAEDYNDTSLSEEEIVIINEGLAELHAGDKGVSLEEFHAGMMTTIAQLKSQKLEVAA